MMNIGKAWIVLGTIIFCLGCNTTSKDAPEDKPATATKAQKTEKKAEIYTPPDFSQLDQNGLTAKIKEIEGELYKNITALDGRNKNAVNVLAAYQAYAKKFPDDAQAPTYLFKAGEIQRTLKRFDKAIGTYKTICDKYPDYDKTPHSLFLLGFTYEEDMKNIAEAKTIYEDFLKKYPKHDLADDVQFSLKNLGKSAEEIIKSFEAQKKGK